MATGPMAGWSALRVVPNTHGIPRLPSCQRLAVLRMGDRAMRTRRLTPKTINTSRLARSRRSEQSSATRQARLARSVATAVKAMIPNTVNGIPADDPDHYEGWDECMDCGCKVPDPTLPCEHCYSDWSTPMLGCPVLPQTEREP